MLLGAEALKMMGEAARSKVAALFPEVENDDFTAEPARLLPPGARLRRLVERHVKNNVQLLCDVDEIHTEGNCGVEAA